MLPVRTVLHPTDFSDRSAPACQVACALARDYGAELVIAHVSRPPIQAVRDGVVLELPSGWEAQTRARLDAVQTPYPLAEIDRRLLVGSPAAEIVRLATELHADLIVLGTHGRTGLSRALLGSVAESVLRNAPCPVITVREPLQMPVEAGAKPEACCEPAVA